MELLTAAQMRAIEQAAIDSGEVTGLELMERAGAGVVEAIFEWRPELAEGERRAVVLCGPGNNGGDGFVVARLLKQRGWAVEVFLYGDEAKLPPDAAENCRRWREMGEVQQLTNKFETYDEERPDTDLCIDAIFGIGLTRPFLEIGNVQDTINYYQSSSEMPDVISIDVPSGLSADTGCYPGCENENPFDSCPMACLTVTFHRGKVGHFLERGPIACGRLAIADIGL